MEVRIPDHDRQRVGVHPFGDPAALGGQPQGPVEPAAAHPGQAQLAEGVGPFGGQDPGQDRGQGAAPLDLGVEVVADGQLAAEVRLLQGLVVLTLGGQGPGQVGGQLRAQPPLPYPLQDPRPPATPA